MALQIADIEQQLEAKFGKKEEPEAQKIEVSKDAKAELREHLSKEYKFEEGKPGPYKENVPQELTGPRVDLLPKREQEVDWSDRVLNKFDNMTDSGVPVADLDLTLEPAAGVLEAAMALSSGMLLYPISVVGGGLRAMIGEGDMAKEVENTVMGLGYQPYTETGKLLMEPVHKGMSTFLKPVSWLDEHMGEENVRIQKLLEKQDRETGENHWMLKKFSSGMSYLTPKMLELLMFRQLGEATQGVKGKAVEINLARELGIEPMQMVRNVIKGKPVYSTELISSAKGIDLVKTSRSAVDNFEGAPADGILEEFLVTRNGKAVGKGAATTIGDVAYVTDVESLGLSQREMMSVYKQFSHISDAKKAVGLRYRGEGRPATRSEVNLERLRNRTMIDPKDAKRMTEAQARGLRMKDLILERHGNIETHLIDSELFVQRIEREFAPEERMAVPFLVEKIKPSEINKLLEDGKITQEVAENALRPSAKLNELVDTVRDYYKDSHSFLKEYFDDVGYHENYANRLWNRAESKVRTGKSTYFVKHNPHLKGRTIPSLFEGMEAGMVPLTTDIAQLVRTYDHYKINTAYNHHFARQIAAMEGILPDGSGTYKLIDTLDRIPTDMRHRYKEIDHPALVKGVYQSQAKGTPVIRMEKVYAHEDIYPYVRNVFGKRFDNKFFNSVEMINNIIKRTNLTLSLFHNVALTEAAAGFGKGGRGFVEIVKGLRKGQPYAMQANNIYLTKDAIRAGLTIKALPDVHASQFQRMLDISEAYLRTKGGKVAAAPMKALSKFNEMWDKTLWDYYHSTYKLLAYEKLVASELTSRHKKGIFPSKNEVARIKREVAGLVNDTFGGQIWEMYGKLGDAKTRQIMQLMLLSPDWTISTIKQAAAPLRLNKPMIAKMGLKFWIKSALWMTAITQSINYYSSYKLYGKGRFTNENPEGKKSYALLPYRGADGEELYLRLGKQFREAYELFVDPVITLLMEGKVDLSKPAGKMSPMVSELSEQFFGAHPGGFPAEWKRKKNESEVKLRAKSLAESIVPFSIKGFVTEQPSSFAGSIPVSKGMSRYQAVQQIAEQLEKGVKPRDMVELRRHALQNNLPWKELVKQGEREYNTKLNYGYKKLANDIVRKFDKSGMKLYEILEIEREKSGLPPKEWNKVAKFVKLKLRERRSIKRQQSRYDIPVTTEYDPYNM